MTIDETPVAGVDGASCDPDLTPPGSALDPHRPEVYALRPAHEAEPILVRASARGASKDEAIDELVVELEAARATAAHALAIGGGPVRAPRAAPERCLGRPAAS